MTSSSTESRELTVLPVANPVAELPPIDASAGQISLSLRVVNLVAVIVPFIGLIAAAVSIWGWGFHWVDLGLLLGMYILTVLGITVGYHRLFTHRSLKPIRSFSASWPFSARWPFKGQC